MKHFSDLITIAAPLPRHRRGQIVKFKITSGTYLGEVMLRDQLGSRGFSWQPDDNGLPLLVDSEKKNAVSPISKVHKKLLPSNDGEGTVSALYRVFLMMLAKDGQ